MPLLLANWFSTVRADLPLLLPEVWLVIGMCAVILVPFVRRDNTMLPTVAAVASLLLALVFTGLSLVSGDGHAFRAVFAGMLTIDPFSQFLKIIIILFTMLIVLQWLLVGRSQVHAWDVPDYLCLLLGASFGMMLMTSASNLLMIFLAMESASMPSFALAGFRKRQKLSTEGSLKYVLFGAAASAVMVYGISLIYGVTGTLSLSALANHAATQGITPLLAVGLAGLLAGFAFKLSAAPMHFWCPDVFQGAPIEVTTFLSVASKAAAVALLARVLSQFSFAAGHEHLIGLATGVGLLGETTACWGNFVALHQTNIKRLLAYSSIGHAGYMTMGCACILLTRGDDVMAALLFYILVYLFMNLGAFTVAALIAQQIGSEDIRDYRGLFHRQRVLSILLIIFMLSLFGMPSLGGFMGKFFLGAAMAKTGVGGFALIAVLLVNTLVSLWFYLRPAYFMVFVPAEDDRPLPALSVPALALLGVCALVLVFTGLLPNPARQLVGDYASIQGAATPPTTQTVSAAHP